MVYALYRIRNVVTGAFYIGGSSNLHAQFIKHRRRLRAGKHPNKHLQATWTEYGKDYFKFETVEKFESLEKLQAAEAKWLVEWANNDKCYNNYAPHNDKCYNNYAPHNDELIESKAPHVLYKVRNIVNNAFYIGGSSNSKQRFETHRRKLRAGKHPNKHLQAAWTEYGEACFKFEKIANFKSLEYLQAAENAWLIEWVGKEGCYNIGRTAESPMKGRTGVDSPRYGYVVPDEEKARISQKLKSYYAENPHPRLGIKHTPEALAKMAANRTPPKGEKHYRYGKHLDEATRKKIGDAQRGVPKNPRVYTEEGLAKIKAAARCGEDSHFYGKRPNNAASLRRAIHAILPDRSTKEYDGLSEMRDTLGVSIPTIIRACKSGNPIVSGALAGWVLSYADEQLNVAPEIPAEFLQLPRSRQEAMTASAPMYFTGLPCSHGHIAPRKTKGTCTECLKIEWKRMNIERAAYFADYNKSDKGKENKAKHYAKKKAE